MNVLCLKNFCVMENNMAATRNLYLAIGFNGVEQWDNAVKHDKLGMELCHK
jgi:hypothetical protein